MNDKPIVLPETEKFFRSIDRTVLLIKLFALSCVALGIGACVRSSHKEKEAVVQPSNPSNAALSPEQIKVLETTQFDRN